MPVPDPESWGRVIRTTRRFETTEPYAMDLYPTDVQGVSGTQIHGTVFVTVLAGPYGPHYYYGLVTEHYGENQDSFIPNADVPVWIRSISHEPLSIGTTYWARPQDYITIIFGTGTGTGTGSGTGTHPSTNTTLPLCIVDDPGGGGGGALVLVNEEGNSNLVHTDITLTTVGGAQTLYVPDADYKASLGGTGFTRGVVTENNQIWSGTKTFVPGIAILNSLSSSSVFLSSPGGGVLTVGTGTGLSDGAAIAHEWRTDNTGAFRCRGTLGVSGTNSTGDVFLGGIITVLSTQGLMWVPTPASSTAPGTIGQVSRDAFGFFYVCYATNAWARFTGSLTWTGPGGSYLVQGRLTITSGSPVADGSGSTLYFTPYKGSAIYLYNTTTSIWDGYQFTEMSIAVPAAAQGTLFMPYDVFAYVSAGVPTLLLVPWSSPRSSWTVSALTAAAPAAVTTSSAHGLSTGDRVGIMGAVGITSVNDMVYTITVLSSTTFSLDGSSTSGTYTANSGTAYWVPPSRSSALGLEDSIPVLASDHSRRYLGTIMTYGTANAYDTPTRRLIHNYYNRIPRKMFVSPAAVNWTYTAAAFRQAGNDQTNRVEVICGYPYEPLDLLVMSSLAINTGAVFVLVAIGEDTVTSRTNDWFVQVESPAANINVTAMARLTKVPTLGHHIYNWLEVGPGGAAVATFFSSGAYSAMSGLWEA